MNYTRRGFLGVVGAGVAGTALPLHAGEAQWKMRLSTSSIQYVSLPLAQACEQIAKLGFEAIDIWDKFIDGNKHLDEAEQLGGAGLRELLAKHNLKLASFTVYKTSYEKYAVLLGAVGGGVAVRGSTYQKFDPKDLVPTMKKFLEGLKSSAALAEQHNSYVAIENHVNCLLHTPDSFKAFVDLNTSPRIGLAIAPFHLQGINAPVEDVIRICGKQAFFFYGWQKGKDFEQLPGRGPTDFKPWLQALADIQYRGYVNPFMHGHQKPEDLTPALAKARDYVKQLAG
jgi:sugar phosphate isomerase/epimerase